MTSSLAACAQNPASPEGFKIWRGDVSPDLAQWAVDLRDHWMPTVNYGSTTSTWWTDPKTGQEQLVAARKDHHTWTYRGGKLISGICIPGITLYRQIPTAGMTGVPGVGDATTDDLTTPDATVAAFTKEPGTDWGLVGVTVGAAALVVGAFFAGLHFAGRAA